MNYTFSQLNNLSQEEFQNYIPSLSDDSIKAIFKAYKDLLLTLSVNDAFFVEDRLDILQKVYSDRYPRNKNSL